MKNLPHIQHPPTSEGDWFAVLGNLARFLRSPNGCPWDREKTSRDFAVYMKEEGDEYIEALDHGDNAHAEEEFGDCLFTLLASAAAAESEGRFNIEQALIRTHEKMIRRHEHVFGDGPAKSPEEAMASWERIKAQEKAEKAAKEAGQ